MARTRKKLGASAETRLQALIEAGGTAESIARTLSAEGFRGMSPRTIGRRMMEARGKQRASRVPRVPAAKTLDGPSVARAKPKAAKASPVSSPVDADEPAVESEVPLPSDPSAIPEGMSLDMLHKMLRQADLAATHALERKTVDKDGNEVATPDLATFGAMGRLVTSVSEAIRKATPPAKVDLEESPDMVAAAKRARDTLHRLVDLTLVAVNG